MTPPVSQTANLMLDAKLTLNKGLEEMERALISATLERTRGNICHAARVLEVHRNTMARRLQALQLKELPAKIRWETKHKLCPAPKLKWMAA
jgi:DNA-binding NtrC family response regulator